MNISINSNQASEILAELLIGGVIDRVVYYVTGWELRVTQPGHDELVLYCSELRIPEQRTWEEALKLRPFCLAPGNEPEDTAAAVAVFNVVNSVPVTATRLEAQGTLVLRFHGGRQLLLPGVVEGVDWTWQLDRDDENLFTCDSGEIFVNSALLKK